MEITRKIKKSAIGIILGFFMLGGLTNCDNTLDEHLYSSVPVSAFYKNQEQAQLALNGAYSGFWNTIYYNGGWFIYNGHTGGVLSDYPDPDEYNVFSWTPSSSSFASTWADTYEAINRTNTLIDKLSESANIPSEAKTQIRGEAKFLRALYYFDLVQLFGEVPLYINGTKDLSEADLSRSSIDEIYKQIIIDLEDAQEDLTPYNESNHADGRATSGATKGLLAKVYAQRKEWSKAATAAKEVMDMGVFELEEDYGNILNPAYSNGKECIFSVQHGNTGNSNDKLGNHSTGRFGPSPQTLQNGTGIEFYYNSSNASEQADQSFFSATPDTYRKWMTMRSKMPYYYIIGTNEFVQDTVTLERPYVTKYYHLDTTTGLLNRGVNYPVIRYSDILLTYAEALNEEKGSPTQAAYDAINRVRARARGVGTTHEQPQEVYPPLSGLSQSQFRDSVLAEEAREFVGEGHRRLDLLRHDMFISDAKKRGINASDKHKLFPIPIDELSRNPNLVQNPGYEQ